MNENSMNKCSVPCLSYIVLVDMVFFERACDNKVTGTNLVPFIAY